MISKFMLDGSIPFWVTNVFFLSLRMTTILIMTPLLFASAIPVSIRTLLILSLSVAIAAGLSPAEATYSLTQLDAGSVMVASARELFLGASLSLGILVAFAAISVAGRLLDIQIGFGMAQVFDPFTRAQAPILSSMLNQLGVIFFFLVDAHHTLLRAVAFSVERFPLGRAAGFDGFVFPMMKHVGSLFSLGFALASPVVFCLLLVELSLGVVARNLPQMNMFVMGVPIKIVVGLATLAMWVVASGDMLNRIHHSIFQTWDWMLSPQASASAWLVQKGASHV